MQKKTLKRMKKLYILFTLISIATSASADNWQPLGNAIVTDGWITPGYVDDEGHQLNPADYPFEVAIEESMESPGIYRLINPFCTDKFHLSEFNLDKSGNDFNIVIDARDRTFVIFQPQYCGFTDEDPESGNELGQYPYYISDMGTYMYNLGQQREVINMLKCASTMRGNTIYVPQPTFGITVDNASQAWDGDATMISTITLPDNFDEESEQWESFGVATMIDGWITPGWKDESGKLINPDDHPIAVEIMQNIENPDIYCLVDPFHETDFAMVHQNLTQSRTRIIIDMTDPDFVTVKPQTAAFVAREENDIRQYFITEAGHYLLANGRTPYEIKEQNHNATYSNGIITIPTPLFAFELNSSYKQWTATHPTYIYMPGAGVRSVTCDASAPVEYYNLQGMRIENPEAGHMYIRRQGSRSDKIFIR